MYLSASVAAISAVLSIFPPLEIQLRCANTSMPRFESVKNENYIIFHPTFTKVASGFDGAEGPVFDQMGNFYATSPGKLPEDFKTVDFTYAGKLHKIDLKTGNSTIVCAPTYGNFNGRPLGTEADREGNIWIADSQLGLWKYTPGRECEQIATVDSEGNPVKSLNDLVFDEYGTLWFTGIIDPEPPEIPSYVTAFTTNLGVLYSLEKGKTIPVRAEELFLVSNGIAVKGKLLLVAEMMAGQIVAFDITGPGQIKNRRVWAKAPKAKYNNLLKFGGPDGMRFDAAGRLLMAHYESSHIEVYSPSGILEARIKCPFAKVTNLRFEPNSCTCYVTEQDNDSVWKFTWGYKGMPVYSDLTSYL